jgi:hypothetical protein
MNRRSFAKTASVLTVGLFLPTHLRSCQQLHQQPLKQHSSEPPFHDHPPRGPLPPTLDPEQFENNANAFAAYSVSAQIRDVLFQVPCYCWCSREQGHESLLDCFAGRHGVNCGICQSEAIYCFVNYKNGKTIHQIRKGLALGEATHFDVARYAKEYYPSLSPNGSERTPAAKPLTRQPE